MKPKRLIGSLNRDTGVSPWGKVPMLRTGLIPVGLFADPQVLSNDPKRPPLISVLAGMAVQFHRNTHNWKQDRLKLLCLIDVVLLNQGSDMEAVTASLLATGTVTETMTTTAAGTITHTVVRKLVVDVSRKEGFALMSKFLAPTAINPVLLSVGIVLGVGYLVYRLQNTPREPVVYDA